MYEASLQRRCGNDRLNVGWCCRGTVAFYFPSRRKKDKTPIGIPSTANRGKLPPALTKSLAPSGEMGSPAVHMFIALRFTSTPSSTSTTTPSFRNCSIIETGQLPSDPKGSGMVSV